MLKRLPVLALLLVAFLVPLTACKVQVPEKLADALAEKISGKKSSDASSPAPTPAQAAPQLRPMSTTVVLGNVIVPSQEFRAYRVNVTDEMKDPSLEGAFRASGGSGNDIIVVILGETAFENFRNGHEVSTYYNSGQLTTQSFNVGLPGAGTYYLVYTNRFSTFSSKNVSTRAELKYMHY